MALPKWTDERTADLTSFVGNESPISQAMVAEAAEQLETSTRSVSRKLRKMGFDVELASASATKSFSEAQEATLSAFVNDNSGSYTYAEIASHFDGGAFSAKSIQGKILSMELTGHVKPAPKVETVRTYTPEEEGTFVEMVNGGSFVEEIADALDKSVNSIRGKALSLLRSGEINAIPKQKETKGSSKADVLADIDIEGLTVEEIADNIGKTVRGVKTMLTRRGLQCSDYNGAAKKEIG
jgi:DNA-binding NarL/FixJ family response regulator